MDPVESPSYLQQAYSAAANLAAYAKIPVLASSAVAVALTGLLYFKQNELIYPRNIPFNVRTDVPRPPEFGITDWEEIHLPTPDGETLHAFFIRPPNKQHAKNVTIIMFHGNAGNIGYRVPIAKVLANNMGFNVFMPEYRGYGLSTGDPNEKGLNIDAQAALDYLRQRPETQKTKIIVYGQSLGGAVSIQLVAKNLADGDIAALILENTFTSIRSLIPSVMPPAKYFARLCHQIWPSETTLPKIVNLPILFLSARKDEIVPPSHMTALYSACKAQNKTWKEFPNGTHNECVMEEGYFEAVYKFISENILDGRSQL